MADLHAEAVEAAEDALEAAEGLSAALERLGYDDLSLWLLKAVSAETIVREVLAHLGRSGADRE
jgi:hypothetical protein